MNVKLFVPALVIGFVGTSMGLAHGAFRRVPAATCFQSDNNSYAPTQGGAVLNNGGAPLSLTCPFIDDAAFTHGTAAHVHLEGYDQNASACASGVACAQSASALTSICGFVIYSTASTGGVTCASPAFQNSFSMTISNGQITNSSGHGSTAGYYAAVYVSIPAVDPVNTTSSIITGYIADDGVSPLN